MSTGSLGNVGSGNRRQTNSGSRKQKTVSKGPSNRRTSEADEDKDEESDIEDEQDAHRQIRPIRRKYNIFRQTRPRGSNPERAVALVCLLNVDMHALK